MATECLDSAEIWQHGLPTSGAGASGGRWDADHVTWRCAIFEFAINGNPKIRKSNQSCSFCWYVFVWQKDVAGNFFCCHKNTSSFKYQGLALHYPDTFVGPVWWWSFVGSVGVAEHGTFCLAVWRCVCVGVNPQYSREFEQIYQDIFFVTRK